MRTARWLARSVMAAWIVSGTLTTATADDWPFFRGPHMNGVSEETGWQAVWPASGPPIAWNKELGIGASSFTVAAGHVLTMGNVNDQDVVYCLDPETGDAHWTFKYDCPLNARQFEGGPAGTPTIDGDRVYTLSWEGQLHCLDLQTGKLIWRKHLVNDFGGTPPKWKYAGSALVQGNLLILDAGGKSSSTLALNKNTGARIWGAGDDTPGYASPIPFDQGKTKALMVFKAKHLVACRLTDGKELWRIPWETAYDVNASTPVVIGETFFASSGYPKGRGALYRLTGGEPKQIWVNDSIKTKMSTCVPCDGAIYGITEKGGALLCMAYVTGDVNWQEKGFGNYGTLIAADGKIIALTESGTLVIVQADRAAYRELARAQVLEGRCWVNPVLANGRIYCKNNKGKMVCIDVRKN